LQEVRKRENVSRRALARRLGITETEVKLLENGLSDVRISTLVSWSQALDVPLADLVAEPCHTLPPVLKQRALLVRVMKTAKSLLEKAKEAPLRRLAENMVQQLEEVMPELHGVTAWPSTGQRRSVHDLGRIVERRLSDDLFARWGDGGEGYGASSGAFADDV
jgi:transcriptional regulator with XRE-family HTH domain